MYRFFSLHISKWILLLLAGDVGVFCFALLLALLFHPTLSSAPLTFLAQHKLAFTLIGLTYLVMLYIGELYDHYKDFRLGIYIVWIIVWTFAGTIMVIVIFFFPLAPFVGRTLLFTQAIFFAILLASWRYAFSAIALPTRLPRKVLIVGAGKAGCEILEAIQKRPGSGLAVIGFVDDDPQKIGTVIKGVPVMGDSNQIYDLINQYKVSLVVVAITYEKSPILISALNRISSNGCQLMDLPNLYEFLTGKIPVDHISDIWLYFHGLNNNKLFYPHIKRLIDIVLVLLGFALSWPLFALISLAIKLDEPRAPIFFRQKRLGQDGKPFQIIKFRTMTPDNNCSKPRWTSTNDPRITRIGRILRKLHLDELPQLVNILKGEMSLIGPRAEWDFFALKSQERIPDWRPGRRAGDPPGFRVMCGYREQVPHYSYRLLVKPGITGWAQVMNPFVGSSQAELKEKLQYDLYYVKNMGFLLDLAILLKTIRIVVFGRGK
ncbi:MAG: sugar transferase [Desulfobacteraceae bacterium]